MEPTVRQIRHKPARFDRGMQATVRAVMAASMAGERACVHAGTVGEARKLAARLAKVGLALQVKRGGAVLEIDGNPLH